MGEEITEKTFVAMELEEDLEEEETNRLQCQLCGKIGHMV